MLNVENDERLKIGIKVSINTIIANAFLSMLKIAIAFIASSNAILADGIHSFSDVITTLGVMVGLKLSNKKADSGHPYGHEKFESITSLFLGIVLFIVAISIGYCGILKIVLNEYTIPGVSAAVAAFISIVVKEWMYHYTLRNAKKINSTSLKADAWHHRSDSLSSIGALLGIIGARCGFPILDPIAAIIISLVIVKVSIDILKESISQLIDKSANDEIISNMVDKIQSIPGVKKIDCLKTRMYATRIYVDVDISVDPDISVEQGHDIAVKVHDIVEENKLVKHCMVHVNPFK